MATEVELKEPFHHGYHHRNHTTADDKASLNAAIACVAVNKVAVEGLQMGSEAETVAGSRGLRMVFAKVTWAGLEAPFHRHHTIAYGTAAQDGTAAQEVAVACGVATVAAGQGSGTAFAKVTVAESEGQLHLHRKQAHGTVVQTVAVACGLAGKQGSVTAFA